MKTTLNQLVRASFIACVGAFSFHNVACSHEYDALIKAKKYVEVNQAISAKLLAEPNNPDALIAKVELILIEGKDSRLDEGAKIAEKCVATNPKNSECHEILGNVLGTKAQKGGVMSAIGYVGKIRDSFKKAVELDPHNFTARHSLLQFYLQAPSFVGGGVGKAKDLVVDTIKISSLEGALLQAALDFHEENYERATSAALAITTANSDIHANQQKNLLSQIGHTYISKKKYLESEKIFSELIHRFPGSSVGYYGLGKSYQEQGKAKEAISSLEKSMTIDPSAATLYRLGKAWQALGDKNKAVALLEKALSFSPELTKSLKSDAEDLLKTLKK